jgi:hypothetical protein
VLLTRNRKAAPLLGFGPFLCVLCVCGKRYAFLTIWDLTLRHCLTVRAPGSGSKKSLSADLAEVCIGWIESGDLVWRVTWFANKEGLAGEGISAPMRFLAETTSQSHREGLEGLIGKETGNTNIKHSRL